MWRFFKRRKPQPPAISLEELLRMIPVKNPRAEAILGPSGDVTVKLKMPPPRGILQRLLPLPEYRTFILDRVGGFVWEAMDGKRNVGEIAHMLVSNFKMSREEAEVSLLRYLQMLSTRGLVFMSVDKSQSGEKEGQRLNQSR